MKSEQGLGGRYAPPDLPSDLGPQTWRPVRASNPRLPTRQAGTASPRKRPPLRAVAALATETTRPTFHPVTGSGAAQSLRPVSAPEACARQGLLELPLRLCPQASLPSDGVSRCTGSGPGPRASRPPTPCRVASEGMDTPEVATCQRASTVAGGGDPSIAGPAPTRPPCVETRKKARNLSASGPLRTELGRRAARRSLLPDSTDPRSDRGHGPSASPRASPPLRTTGRTRPAPAGVGGFE